MQVAVRKLVAALRLFPQRNGLTCRSLATVEEKWRYNDEDITRIVKHMQTIALLNSESETTVQRQSEYLKSAMKIAEGLAHVDVSDVQPFHNPAQFVITNDSKRDDIVVNEEGALNNSTNLTNSGHIKAPSIL